MVTPKVREQGLLFILARDGVCVGGGSNGFMGFSGTLAWRQKNTSAGICTSHTDCINVLDLTFESVRHTVNTNKPQGQLKVEEY